VLVQVGKYKPAQRAAVVACKGAHVFGVSFVASMAGHSLTKYLVILSSVLSPGTILLHETLLLGAIMAVVRFVHCSSHSMGHLSVLLQLDTGGNSEV